MKQDQPAVSIVVIGLNEAKNLENTFTAIRSMNYPGELVELIYVDSGSTDTSVGIAKRYCDKVFVEPEWPTAARNRNRGLIESTHEYCHFLDGDILIDPDYIQHAIAKINEGEVQAVFGYLDEKSNKGLSRILLHDYKNRKPGFINAPGAGGTFLKKVLVDVNGWDERIPRAEEMEIGDRLINAGYKIWYLNQKMGIHDFGVTNIFKLMKKQIGEGLSIGAVARIPETGRVYALIRKLARRNILFHLIILLIILGSVIFKNLWLIPGSFAFYLVYLFVKYRIIRGIRNIDSILYHYLKNLTKVFELYGYFKFQLRYSKLTPGQKISLHKRVDIKAAILNRDGSK